MNPPTSLTVQRAAPADYPDIARLMAENFRGKFAIALGRDTDVRARRIETLLPTGIICPGHIYVIYSGDTLATTFTLKTADTIPTAPDYARARRTLAKTDGPLRAWWAITILRTFSGPKLGPDDVYLDNLVTARTFQRQGIARQAAAFAYQQARRLGKAVIWADVISSNYRVMGLVEKEGWEIVSRTYWFAPITWPLLGAPGIYRIRKRLSE